LLIFDQWVVGFQLQRDADTRPRQSECTGVHEHFIVGQHLQRRNGRQLHYKRILSKEWSAECRSCCRSTGLAWVLEWSMRPSSILQK